VCDCRKPSIGLVEEIKRDHDLRNSQFIVLGDTFSDYELSLKLNANFYLIKSELTEMEKFLNLNIKPHETNVI
jgi:histidinol phosphatase-like enzyme